MHKYLRKISIALLVLFCSLSNMYSFAMEDYPVSEPVSETDTSLNSRKHVAYDCVYFGLYPQTELLRDEAESGALGKLWRDTSDYVVDSLLYEKVKDAFFNEPGSLNSLKYVTVDGVTYCHITSNDATYVNKTALDSYAYYNWNNVGEDGMFFICEPIKWRVLSVDEKGYALLFADKILDSQPFSTKSSGFWEYSNIRSWLNSYNSSFNTGGLDHTEDGFLNNAFSLSERNAIVSTDLTAEKTQDKVFLLTLNDLKNTGYGFIADNAAIKDKAGDNARRALASGFAKAMGTKNITSAITIRCSEWLTRSTDQTGMIFYIDSTGMAGSKMSYTNTKSVGIRPALYLNLANSDVYSYAGKVVTDEEYGTIFEISSAALEYYQATYTGTAFEPAVTVRNNRDEILTEGEDYTVTYSDNVEAGIATVYIEGKGKYETSIVQNFTIKPQNADNWSFAIEYSSTVYNGKTKCPSVIVKDKDGQLLTEGVEYTVSYSNNKSVGKGAVNIKAIGNYSGTYSKLFTISPKKATVSKITPSSRTLSLKASKKPSAFGGSAFQIAYKQNGTNKWKYTTSRNQIKDLLYLVSGKKYTIKIRAYKKVNGKTFYGEWSKKYTSRRVK